MSSHQPCYHVQIRETTNTPLLHTAAQNTTMVTAQITNKIIGMGS